MSFNPDKEVPQLQPDEDNYLQSMCYPQELEKIEQPGVGGDQPEEGSHYPETEGSRYPETEPVDYSVPEKGEKKRKNISNITVIHSCNPPKCVLPSVTVFTLSAM